MSNYILCILIWCLNASTLTAQHSSKIFIEGKSDRDTSHSIYIEDDRTSKYYDKILDFGFGRFDQASYDLSLEYLKEKNIPLEKSVFDGIAKEWVIIYQYKGKYYVYHPCDFLFHYKVSLNDTTFIDWTGEGPVASKILSYKKVSKDKIQLELTGIYDENRKLMIHIIDPVKGIAVFENEVNGSHLMIDADKIRSVPIIINYCPTQKELELNFDKTDYTKLLKK